MDKSSKRLILLEMNEINFDVVEEYVAAQPDRFPSLKKILSGPRVRTTSEQKYENLEPWIQWPSVHTGMTYAEHGIFRLGDIVGSKAPQIFERLEQAGYKVGAISPMNTENRLKLPTYFIPDPWTQTPPDDSWWSKILSESICQAVNDNSQSRITVKSALQIFLAFIRFGPLAHYGMYLNLVLNSRKRPWLKALVLDLLLHDVHWNMFKDKKPNFSALFLNAGAHIQHHYFFNAEPIKAKFLNRNPDGYVSAYLDPFADVLGLYDMIVGELFGQRDAEVILSTALSQKPYDRIKFYYRLREPSTFLDRLDIDYKEVHPRMTRDFLIEFSTVDQATEAKKILVEILVGDDGLPLFGKIDNRGCSLFVTLTYSKEIFECTTLDINGRKIKLKPLVNFVAIKNGMHQETGFAFFTPKVACYAPENQAHVSRLNKSILDYFDLEEVKVDP